MRDRVTFGVQAMNAVKIAGYVAAMYSLSSVVLLMAVRSPAHRMTERGLLAVLIVGWFVASAATAAFYRLWRSRHRRAIAVDSAAKEKDMDSEYKMKWDEREREWDEKEREWAEQPEERVRQGVLEWTERDRDDAVNHWTASQEMAHLARKKWEENFKEHAWAMERAALREENAHLLKILGRKHVPPVKSPGPPRIRPRARMTSLVGNRKDGHGHGTGTPSPPSHRHGVALHSSGSAQDSQSA